MRELESLEFEPALELEPPLLLQLLVDLQEQLVLALELQVAELQRLGQERRLKPLGVEPALVQGLPRELLVRLELQRLVVPGLLPLVALRG